MGSLLKSFRILDLTDHKGHFCGKIMADMGAEVIKVERPGGDPDRHIGPFFENAPDPEKSLHWFAYNLNKKGITLNLETADGKAIFEKLVKSADAVIESYPVGYLEKLGLGYAALRSINPRIIMTSITPFGQTGPYSEYKGTDLICMAMGGLAYITGDAQGSPVRVSFAQSYLLASAEAAAASMMAYYHREKTGNGQYIDVSIQASVAGKLSNAVPTWELNGNIIKRQGRYMVGRGAKLKMQLLWRCKDGHVTFALMGGKLGAKSNQKVAQWIVDDGSAPDFFKEIDWAALDIAKQSQVEQDRLEGVVAGFFAKHTKAELYKMANADGVLLCPQSSMKDIAENEQLQDRQFWMEVDHPQLNSTITYPGPFLKATATAITAKQKAPQIGEHNEQIFIGELGLTREAVTHKQQTGVI